MARAGPTACEFRTVFRAPLPFAYAWCTDYTPDDNRLEGSTGPRKIVRREKDRVLYEDLQETPGGWLWSHWDVTLRPPDRWHGDGLGNYRRWSVDYSLRALSDRRTEFRFKGKRWPANLGTESPPRAKLERTLLQSWKKLGRVLEADYRRSLSRRPARGRSSRRAR